MRVTGEIQSWKGEVSPRFRDRAELPAHDGGLETALNVRRTLQGTLQSRPGSRILREASRNPANVVRHNSQRGIPFKFSDEDSFVLFFDFHTFTNSDGHEQASCIIHVLRKGIAIGLFSDVALGDDFREFFRSGHSHATTVVREIVDEMDFAQYNDALILTHRASHPLLIQRTSGDGSSSSHWEVKRYPFETLPRFRTVPKFDLPGEGEVDNEDSHPFLIGVPATNLWTAAQGPGYATLAFVHSGGNADNPTGDYEGNQVNDLGFEPGFENPNLKNSPYIIVDRDDEDSDWGESTKSLLARQAHGSQHIGQHIVSNDRGVEMRILGFSQVQNVEDAPLPGKPDRQTGRAYAMNVYIIKGFPNAGIGQDYFELPWNNWTIQFGYTDILNLENTYPSSVAIHESRVCFSGSNDIPTGLWMSGTAFPFHFDSFSVDDDQPIFVELALKEYNRISNLYSSTRLAAMTSDTIVWVFGGDEFSGITPSNITTQTIDGLGIDPRHSAFIADNSITFLGDGGKAVLQLYYNAEERRYQQLNLSLLTPDFLKSGVVSIAVVNTKNPSVGDTIYLVNGDGAICLIQVLHSEEVISGTRWELPYGKVREVVSDEDDLYFAVELNVPEATDSNQILFGVFDDKIPLDYVGLKPLGLESTPPFGYSFADTLAWDMWDITYDKGTFGEAEILKVISFGYGGVRMVSGNVLRNSLFIATFPLNLLPTDNNPVTIYGIPFIKRLKTLPLPAFSNGKQLSAHRRKRIARCRLLPHLLFGVSWFGDSEGGYADIPENVRVEPPTADNANHGSITRNRIDEWTEGRGAGYERYAIIELETYYPMEIGAISYELKVGR